MVEVTRSTAGEEEEARSSPVVPREGGAPPCHWEEGAPPRHGEGGPLPCHGKGGALPRHGEGGPLPPPNHGEGGAPASQGGRSIAVEWEREERREREVRAVRERLRVWSETLSGQVVYIYAERAIGPRRAV